MTGLMLVIVYPLKKWLLEQKYFVDFDRVRIMALDPNGYIESHNDYNKSKLGPTNIAINNPKRL